MEGGPPASWTLRDWVIVVAMLLVVVAVFVVGSAVDP